MPPELDAESLQQYLDSSHRTRLILGITGPPGVGKSTLALHLAARRGPQLAVVAMDGFHLSNAELARRNLLGRKGAPDTFDVDGFISSLARIRASSATVYVPAFDRSLDEPIAASVAIEPSHDVILVEGNYLLLQGGPWKHVRPMLDACIYIDAEWRELEQRLVARHVSHGKARQAAARFVEASDRVNATVIAATQPLADFHIRTEEVGRAIQVEPPPESNGGPPPPAKEAR